MGARRILQYYILRIFVILSSMSFTFSYRNPADTTRAKYSSLPENPKQNEDSQEYLLSAFGKVACAGSRCLKANPNGFTHWHYFNCSLCDAGSTTKDRPPEVYWDRSERGEDWKEAVAGLLAITKEPKFQASTKPRVLMAVTIGRLFNHISDSDYLNLDVCELGQWLLASLGRSLRELKIAAT